MLLSYTFSFLICIKAVQKKKKEITIIKLYFFFLICIKAAQKKTKKHYFCAYSQSKYNQRKSNYHYLFLMPIVGMNKVGRVLTPCKELPKIPVPIEEVETP